MNSLTVDEVYNQAQQLSPAERRQLFDRLLEDIAPEPPHTVHTVEELPQQLQAGLDSGPATPMTQTDWDSIRQQVRDCATQRSALSSPAR